MGVSSVLWLPITSGLFLMLVPRREWLTTLLLNILVAIASVVVFYGRDVTLNGYFAIEGDLARICVGIVAPATMTMVIMESYFVFAFHMLQFRCLRFAAVLMGGPVCFGLTLATILQLGSTSVVSGVCIEFGSLLVELRFKYCLLSGTTPLQSLRDRLCCLGRCCSHRKTGRMSFVHPGFDNIVSLDPTVLGAQQAGSGERAGETHGDAGPCSETLDNDGPEKDRRHLLAMIVAYYNIVGAVAQVTVAGFLIVAKVQPNKSWSAPLPPSKILALVGLRLAFDVLGDMAITAVAHCCQPKGVHALAEAWGNLGWQGLASVCFLALVWSADAMMLYMTFLCPVPVQRGAVDPFTVELLALGLCPHRSHLLQLS
ncbi:unnamed protein product [Prorocentrum cordatum]|nr:unnamed protein product [Polarella glacialis]